MAEEKKEEFTLKENLKEDIAEWHKVIDKIIQNESYSKFLKITGKNDLVVVKNQPNLTNNNERAQCHENVRLAVNNGKGEQVFGWYVMCEYNFNEMPIGMFRLVHHSNLLTSNNELLNITDDFNKPFHIFLKDEKRKFDFNALVGYNDRMVLGDEFLADAKFVSIPRNKVIFSANDEIDRDLYYEKFTMYRSSAEVLEAIPKLLNGKDRQKWITLKTTSSLIS